MFRITICYVKDILTINNHIHTIEVPTRVTTTSATLLDLIIVPGSEKKKTKKKPDFGVIEISLAISNHYILSDFSCKHEHFNRKARLG